MPAGKPSKSRYAASSVVAPDDAVSGDERTIPIDSSSRSMHSEADRIETDHSTPVENRMADCLPDARAGDVTRRVRPMRRALDDELTRLSEALDHSGVGLVTVDLDRRLLAVNTSFARICGHESNELIHKDWLFAIVPRDRPEVEAARQQLASRGKMRAEAEGRRKDGSTFFVQLSMVSTVDAQGQSTGFTCVFLEITDRKRLEQHLDAVHDWLVEGNDQLEHQLARSNEQTLQLELRKAELERANRRLEAQVTTDGLTGLKNHRTFHERLREEVDRAARYRSALSVVLLDVDDFKTFNDTFGHPAGDSVLRIVAELLQANARTTDVVARYGGEEFALILTETDSDAARVTAERCRIAIESFPWQERYVTASLGVATLSISTADAAELIGRADGALYRSKRRGRNRVTRATDPLDASEILGGGLETTEDMAQQTLDFQSGSLAAAAQTLKERLSRSYDSTVESWSRILDLQDKETEGHSKRVTAMTVRLARAVGMSEEEILYTKWGALLHDIGKMAVPNTILHKPGPLTDEEWEVMRRHPVMAYEMLAPISFLGPALDIPHYHHEKWDGTGYPCGLKGDEIPLPTRLFAVVDVYDALRTDRPYRKAWPESRVRKHLRERSGTHFDPRAVRTFLKVLDESNASPRRKTATHE